MKMWPDGYYYQRQMFYSSKWMKEMEKTFVDALLGHASAGFFCPGRRNIHTVMCSIYDVNKKHGTKVSYEWAQTRVARLQECYEVFRWVVHSDGVVWNQRLGFVTAHDQIWKALCRENKRAKYYINAYEDLWEELCKLFDLENYPDNEVIDTNRFDLNMPTPEQGWVDAAHVMPNPPATDQQLINLTDSSESSSSMWKWVDEFNGSDNDADSILPPPGVPLSVLKKNAPPLVSPPSTKLVGAISSTASNATPLKKEE